MRRNSECRETLRSTARLLGKTVVIAPSRIGPFQIDDLGMFLQDAELLASLGVQVCLVEDERTAFWDERVPGGIEYVRVKGEDKLVSLCAERSAIKLCLLSGTDRITSKGVQLDAVPVVEARRLLSEKAIVTSEGEATLRLAISACESGIPRVHIFNVHRNGALLDELCTDFGIGTMVHADLYHKEVRSMQPGEHYSVCMLLRERIPHRTSEFIREKGHEIRVFVVDGDVHGVARVSLRDESLVIRTLAHSPRANAAEALASLIRSVMREAREQGVERVVLPTDEMPALMRILPWFQDLGFTKGHVSFGVGKQDAWSKRVT